MMNDTSETVGAESSFFTYSVFRQPFGKSPTKNLTLGLPTAPATKSAVCFPCCKKREIDVNQSHYIAPDDEFHADSEIDLPLGKTAYKLIKPPQISNHASTNKLKRIDRSIIGDPIIVCLHGFCNSSYMWQTIATILSSFEDGPQAQVLVFDFYGRGRSEWRGNKLTLNALVVQTKDLLDELGFQDVPVSLVGFDMGGAVAVGFAAKYPDLCRSLALLAPTGAGRSLSLPLSRWLVRSKPHCMAALAMRHGGLATLRRSQREHFFDLDEATTHHHLITKQERMLEWQLEHAPGGRNSFLQALLSSARYFPFDDLEELYFAVGRHPRMTLVLWGDHDTVCDYQSGMKVMEDAFRSGFVVDILDCGHALVLEKFEEVSRELMSFHTLVFTTVA